MFFFSQYANRPSSRPNGSFSTNFLHILVFHCCLEAIGHLLFTHFNDTQPHVLKLSSMTLYAGDSFS